MLDRVELPPDRARRATLAASIEWGDPEGAWIPLATREEGTRRAREALGDDPTPDRLATAVADRADHLLEPVLERDPAFARAAHGAPRGLLIALVIGPALLYGIGRSALGPDASVDIFQNPLVALVLWNLFVLFASALVRLARALLRDRRKGSAAPTAEDERPLVTGTPWLSTRIAEWLLALGVGGRRVGDAERAARRARILTEFGDRWRRAAAPSVALTVRLGLHAAALLLLASAVGEAYLRGLFTQYEVSWQSTFLDAESAGTLARVLFGPAAALLGEGSVSLPAEGDAVDAAPWIHRFAVTALLLGVVPRALLTVVTWNARRRLRTVTVPVGTGLARRLHARATTAFARVAVLPYSIALESGARDRLRGLLAELLGERAVLEFAEPLAYGDESVDETDAPAGEDLCRVVVLPLGQPPETEVHGAFLRALARGSAPVVAVVEGSALRERLGDTDEGRRRREERTRNWDRVLADCGAPHAHLDLGVEPDDAAYAALGRAIAAAQGEEAR